MVKEFLQKILEEFPPVFLGEGVPKTT